MDMQKWQNHTMQFLQGSIQKSKSGGFRGGSLSLVTLIAPRLSLREYPLKFMAGESRGFNESTDRHFSLSFFQGIEPND